VFKRLVVVPATDLTFDALLLRLAQTSMWDGKNDENEAKGFYAWDQYVEFLRKRGCNHTALLVTKIKFDPRVAYPKLLFGATRYLDKDEWAMVKERTEEEATMSLLEAPETATAARKPVEEAEPVKKLAAPAVAADDDDEEEVQPKKGKKAAPAPAAAADDDDDDVVIPKKGKKATAEAAVAAEAAVKKAKAAPAATDDDDEVQPKKVKAKDDKGLGALLDQWDD
jgi:hypothetical protein